MNKPVNSSSHTWNQKQKNYPRFDIDDCKFEQDIIKCVKKWGVVFEGKSIIDIGCGTGKYTILLAKEAKGIDAIDFSDKMLEILCEDAKKMKLEHKINPICQDFNDFSQDKRYDIAISTMSPAIFSKNEYEKMNSLATKKVYLGWGGKRESKITNAIFNSHGLTSHTQKASEYLKQWLVENDIKFKSKFFNSSWQNEAKLEDALEDEAWHLSIHGVNPDKDVIKKILLEHINKNGYIINKTNVKLELIIW